MPLIADPVQCITYCFISLCFVVGVVAAAVAGEWLLVLVLRGIQRQFKRLEYVFIEQSKYL